MSELMPKLELRKVAPEKLIPDPNNPRLIKNDDEQYDNQEALYHLDRTLSRMRGGDGDDNQKDRYKIKELENSIIENGWWPIDFIFVRSFGDGKHYLVLEGNRRVTAIRNLRNSDETPEKIKGSLNEIEVMEIIGETNEGVLREKITYLLGVRHHGSLKKWTPFAQAHNIFMRYLELSGQTSESFKWDAVLGEQVANALSVDVKDVENRLRVYRTMEQVDLSPIMEGAEGEVQDRYYSVIAEVLMSRNKILKNYIKQSDEDFLLEKDSLARIINLCHFERRGREGSPINNPQEWRKLANILKEEDDERRDEMLAAVEVDKIKPSDVWAERASELQKVTWDKWLFKLISIINNVSLGQVDIHNEEAREVTKNIVNLIDRLEENDVESGV